MSYPFTTFPLVNRVGVTNPYANVDARYGPWLSLTDALTSFNAGLRFRGLTVGIYEPNFNTNGSIVEYWFKDGVADGNLVLKTAGGVVPGNVILDGGNTNAANITVGTNDNYHLNLETAGSTRVIITSSGNVGIGITNPNDRLEVSGTIKVPNVFPSIRTSINRFTVNEGGLGPPNETGMVTQFSSGPYGRSVFAVTHTGVNTAFFGLNAQTFSIGGEGDTDVRFVKELSYGAIDILNSGTEVMRIKASNSSVGIGTNDPSQRLTVAGNISSTNILYSGLGNSNQWQDNYTFTQTNSGNWGQDVLILSSNLPANTVNTFSPTLYGIGYQTVNNDQRYLFTSDFSQGRTLTLFISGNHESIKRHEVTFSGGFNLQIGGAGQSNIFYTFKNHTTKVTLTRLAGSLQTFIRGTAEIIRTDLNQNQGGLGFINLETTTGPTDFLLQENGGRLVIRNFT